MEEQLPRSDGAGLRIRPHVSNSVEMCGDVWTAWWLFNAEQPPWRDGSGRSVEWLKEVWNVWTIGGNGMGALKLHQTAPREVWEGRSNSTRVVIDRHPLFMHQPPLIPFPFPE